MIYEVEYRKDICIVRLVGLVCGDQLIEPYKRLQEEVKKDNFKIIFDLSKTRLMDTAGLGLLYYPAIFAQGHGRGALFPKIKKEILKYNIIENFYKVCYNEAEAIEALKEEEDAI